MTHYNKENGRKNMRLHGYDYSRAGLYFLTIVVQNRLQLFGEINRMGVPASSLGIAPKKMFLNDAGIMIEKWYREIENKFPDKRCHEMVVMPNHFHCIIENIEMGANDVIWDTHVSSLDAHVSEMDAHVSLSDAHVSEMDAHVSLSDAHVSEMDAHVVGAPLRGRPDSHPDSHPDSNEHENTETDDRNNTDEKYGLHNKKYGATIGDVMDWFKTMTTNEYIRGVKNNNWQRFDGKLWQRNYYDHIIRDWQDDVRISTYIIENPAKWKDDRFNI